MVVYTQTMVGGLIDAGYYDVSDLMQTTDIWLVPCEQRGATLLPASPPPPHHLIRYCVQQLWRQVYCSYRSRQLNCDKLTLSFNDLSGY